jgi:methyl-accepting chemotaxis protein
MDTLKSYAANTKDSILGTIRSGVGFHSLGTRLVVMFLVLALVPLVVVATLAGREAESALTTQISGELGQSNAASAIAFQDWIKERKDDVAVVAGAIPSLDSSVAGPIVKRYFDQWQVYEAIALAGPDGKTIYRVDGTTAVDVSDREYFIRAMKGETVIVGPLISKATGTIISTVAGPVKQNNKVVGIILANVPTTYFVKLLERTRTGDTGEAYLVSTDGLLATPSRFIDDLKRTHQITDTAEMVLKINSQGARAGLAGKTGVEQYDNYLGVPVIGAYQPIIGTPWALLTERSAAEAMAPVTHLQRLMVAVMVLATALIMLVALVLARNIIKPIHLVTQMAKQIGEQDLEALTARFGELAKGNLSTELSITTAPIKVHSQDEIGLMAQAFNQMLDRFGRVSESFMQMNTHLKQVIDDITRVSQGLATGDLTVHPQAEYEGDFAQVKTALTTALGGLNGTLRQINGVVVQVSQSVSQVRSVSQDLSTNAQEQSSVVEQVTNNVERTDGQVKLSAEGAHTANELVVHTSTLAQAGQAKMQTLTRAMGAIAQSSREVGKIIKVIDDIAFQTNLLALNAAVEAARAGKAGRGFAVVAQEVRNLAERSAKAAQSTSDLIQNASVRTEEGVKLTRETGTALSEIAQNVAKVKDLAGEIAVTSEDQTRALAQVSQAMGQVNQGAQSSSAQSEELASTADELGVLAERLRDEAARFKLQERTAADAASDTAWLAEFSQADLVRLVNQYTAQSASKSKTVHALN